MAVMRQHLTNSLLLILLSSLAPHLEAFVTTNGLSRIFGSTLTTSSSSLPSSSVSHAGDLGSLKVPELKELLRDMGLPVSGRKSELIDRIISASASSDEKNELQEKESKAFEFGQEASDTTGIEPISDDEQHDISFDGLGLSTEVLRNIRFDTPTPIQSLAIPQMVAENNNGNKNVWLQSPTGSGKTLVYGTSLWHHLTKKGLTKESAQNGNGIRALILVPSRELAIQVASELQQMAPTWWKKQKNQQKVGLIHGGVPIDSQLLGNDDNGDMPVPSVVVATPGRLLDILGVSNSGYDDEEEHTSYNDAELQAKLMQAMDQRSKGEKRGDVSLSLQDLEDLGLSSSPPLSSPRPGRRPRRPSRGHGNDEYSYYENHREAKTDARPCTDLLQNLEHLILDEADRLFSRAFEREIDDLLKLIKPSPTFGLRTWLLSATFPKSIEPRIDQVLRKLNDDDRGTHNKEVKDPTILRISCHQSDRLLEENSAEVSASLQRRLERSKVNNHVNRREMQQITPASTIKLSTIRVSKPDRTQVLRRLLETHKSEEWDRVLVFCGTRYTAEHVARKLKRVGISASELHGKLDQNARSRRLRAFEQGRTRVLLATDLASRGLDISGLPAVVNYDLPRSTTDFVHRVGRTGRANRPGTAVTLLTPDMEHHLDLIERKHLPEPAERIVLPGFEPNEEEWLVQSQASRLSIPGASGHSPQGLVHDRMYGGIKGKRKSKKDRLREKAARAQGLGM